MCLTSYSNAILLNILSEKFFTTISSMESTWREVKNVKSYIVPNVRVEFSNGVIMYCDINVIPDDYLNILAETVIIS